MSTTALGVDVDQPGPRGSVRQRFWKRVDKRAPDQCWNWTGGKTTAKYGHYGQLHIAGREVKAHRVSHELNVGPIPEGLQIDHLCENKLCVNPAHLEPVTQGENMRRAPQIQRAREWAAQITHCPHGHEYTPENTMTEKGPNGPKRKCRACTYERNRAAASRRAHEARQAHPSNAKGGSG